MASIPSPFNQNNPDGLSAPAGMVVAVTASDSADLPDGICRSLLVGTGGAADILDATGVKRSAVPLQTGYNPIGVQRVYATNIVASNIWALY